jgi:hypothetical protein
VIAAPADFGAAQAARIAQDARIAEELRAEQKIRAALTALVAA